MPGILKKKKNTSLPHFPTAIHSKPTQLFSSAHVLDEVLPTNSLVYTSGTSNGKELHPPAKHRPPAAEPSSNSRCMGFEQSYGIIEGFVRSVHLAKSSPLVDGSVESCCKACDQVLTG